MSVTMTINGDALKGVEVGNIKSLADVSEIIVSQAKLLAPFDDGLLRNSIMARTGFGEYGHEEGDKITPIPKDNEAYVGSNVKYASYQEFGTKYMAPQPFLRPAIALAKGQSTLAVMNKIMIDNMQGALKKGKKRVKF